MNVVRRHRLNTGAALKPLTYMRLPPTPSSSPRSWPTRRNVTGSPSGRSSGECHRHLRTLDEHTEKVLRANRERTIERVLAIFRGRGVAGDPSANSQEQEASRSMRWPSISSTAGTSRVEPTTGETTPNGWSLRGGTTRSGRPTSLAPDLAPSMPGRAGFGGSDGVSAVRRRSAPWKRCPG
jgi:hypothetical protein